MLVAEKVQFEVTIELPPDWKEQVTALADLHGLTVTGASRIPGGAVMSFAASSSIGGQEEAFKSAVTTAISEISAFLAPPPPAPPAFREELLAAKERVARGEQPEITGRQLLGWFGAARRGSRVVEWIRHELDVVGLVTEPDFTEVWVDVPIKLRAKPSDGASQPRVSATNPARVVEAIDPVYRIGQLAAANQPVVSIGLGTAVGEALTVMMLREYSQLPVMRSDRDCRGAISWQSVGKAIALGQPHSTVDECMQRAIEVSVDANLFETIPSIVSEGFVLVRGRDRRVQGIVTVADLSVQFRDWTEPFLLLGQIENLIRELVRKSFTVDELRAAKNPSDETRVVNEVSDLTFGEYVRLLEPTTAWPKLGVTFHRDPFLKDLRSTQEIRNEVMHFNPDPLGSAQLALLRSFASFLEQAARARVADSHQAPVAE